MMWIFSLLTFASTGQAEYRVFELVITDSTSGQERVVVSNLDPRQYVHYYPVKSSETVMYRSTWMCRGNTSHHKPICPNPKGEGQKS